MVMQRYTTEWAKEWFKEPGHEIYNYLCQDDDREVWAFTVEPIICDNWTWDFKDDENSAKEYALPIDTMLEHPDGWQNSKVTRGDL